ncbi:YcnI family copper-binding membrane protein [Salinifilum ghardaiensis]
MSTKRLITRSGVLLGTCGLTGLLGAPLAAAHVTVEPDTAARGDSADVTFTVPNERPDAGTVRVRVRFPQEAPISSVRTKPVPGWDAHVEKRHLDRPVEVAGSEVTEVVRSITWTAQGGTRIGPDQYGEFEVSIGALPTSTDRVVLPTAQTYDSGEVVNWDAQPAGEGRPEPEHPAPSVQLTSGGGGGEQERGTARATGSGESAGQPATDTTARWVGGAGLAVGALGLGIALGTLLRIRGGKR